MATSQDVNLAYTWLQGQSNKGVSDTLSDPFTIVNDHHKRQKTNTSLSESVNKDIPISVSKAVKLHEASSPTSQPQSLIPEVSPIMSDLELKWTHTTPTRIAIHHLAILIHDI